jgi:hypothetical protein
VASSKKSVEDVLDTLDDIANSEDDVTVGDVTQALGGRGFGPLITLPALLILTPIGGIPTVPSLMALVIALFAVQMVMQKDTPWLPEFLKNRGISDEKVKRSTQKLRRTARWMDRTFGDRLTALTEQPASMLVAGVVLLLCALVPPSEIVPFAALLPMGAIALLGLALTVHDGALVLGGLMAAAAGLLGIWTWVF